jgi:hypothetical protein
VKIREIDAFLHLVVNAVVTVACYKGYQFADFCKVVVCRSQLHFFEHFQNDNGTDFDTCGIGVALFGYALFRQFEKFDFSLYDAANVLRVMLFV